MVRAGHAHGTHFLYFGTRLTAENETSLPAARNRCSTEFPRYVPLPLTMLIPWQIHG